jgi:site-specific DNA-cytosine methylase
MPKVLELFSGTGSVSKVCEKLGYPVVSIDITDKFHKPTHIVDILTWDYKSEYPQGYFDIIWASPPCQTFSMTNYFNPYTRDIKYELIEKYGLPLLRKTEEIIDYYNPKLYFIENPNGFMKQYIDRPLYMVDYCQYSDFGYRKRTCIWTNKENFKGKLCNKNCPNKVGNKHFKIVIKTTKKNKITLAERYRVPFKLIKELLITKNEDNLSIEHNIINS